MKCNKCPLYSYWNNENDKGESCGLFGDSWDSPFQYYNDEGAIIGCYIEKAFIDKTEELSDFHNCQYYEERKVSVNGMDTRTTQTI